GDPVALSEVFHMFEHMGLRVGDEQPYPVTPPDGPATWLYDFGLDYPAELDVDAVRERFHDAFVSTWRGAVEDDGLNVLVLDAVQSLDEDRILRSFLTVMRAMLRTNHFQRTASGEPKPYLAFKLDPTRVPLLPAPRPRYEIFVCSPRVEGVHLRGGSVARGGL